MVNVSPAHFQAMRWRCIGPFRGARVVSVAADPCNPLSILLRGVWRGRLED